VLLGQGTVTNAVQALASALYYAVFRWAETRLGPGWGWFLGLAKPPSYPNLPAGAPRRSRWLRWFRRPRAGGAT
jgi:hypothetical protein